jgi:2-dehydro-3-deoxygalactonokinase
MNAAAVIVDWGTSSFRAYRAGERGLETRAAEAGILSVGDGDFESALRRYAGDWIVPGTPVFLSGMITSRNGWVETPYIETPASLADLAAATVERRLADGTRLRFLPGVCQRQPSPDVMRGEEIQVFGSVAADEDALVVLPGTHSKWVDVRAGRIAGFHSTMTGEVYAVLKAHSILGRLLPEGATVDAAGFRLGVEAALARRPGGLLHDIFGARSGVLVGDLSPSDAAGYLSGLLIGHEIREGLAAADGRSPMLVGSAALVGHYRTAFALAGVEALAGPQDAAVRGFRRLGLELGRDQDLKA